MSDKLWLFLAASFLAGLLAAWFTPASMKEQFGNFLPFVLLGYLALTLVNLMVCVLALRLGRPDVTAAERFARSLFFRTSPSS
jgi:hypothetical protein